MPLPQFRHFFQDYFDGKKHTATLNAMFEAIYAALSPNFISSKDTAKQNPRMTWGVTEVTVDSTSRGTVTHNLGTTPDVVIAIPAAQDGGTVIWSSINAMETNYTSTTFTFRVLAGNNTASSTGKVAWVAIAND